MWSKRQMLRGCVCVCVRCLGPKVLGSVSQRARGNPSDKVKAIPGTWRYDGRINPSLNSPLGFSFGRNLLTGFPLVYHVNLKQGLRQSPWLLISNKVHFGSHSHLWLLIYTLFIHAPVLISHMGGNPGRAFSVTLPFRGSDRDRQALALLLASPAPEPRQAAREGM